MTNPTIKDMYEQLMSNPDYNKLFDEFSDEQKAIMKINIKKFIEETEQKLIIPLSVYANNSK
jgi:hypothetical protein